MKQTTTTRSTPDSIGYVSRAVIIPVIILLILNFLLLFCPFLEISWQEKIWSGGTYYDSMYMPTSTETMTQTITMSLIQTTVLAIGIPYLCYFIYLAVTMVKKAGKNDSSESEKKPPKKPLQFAWPKFAAIANVANAVVLCYTFLIYTFTEAKNMYHANASCHITIFGVLNILCSVALAVLLFVLSHKTKKMFTPVADTIQPAVSDEATVSAEFAIAAEPAVSAESAASIDPATTQTTEADAADAADEGKKNDGNQQTLTE